MKDESDSENKKQEPKENKAVYPSSNKKVKVRINPKRAIAGVGMAGDVVSMDETVANEYERKGTVTILKEK